MLQFLFGKRRADTQTRESLREAGARALDELNDVLAALPDLPDITIRTAGGRIDIDWPEQLPDEAKALPAPDTAMTDTASTGSAKPDTSGVESGAGRADERPGEARPGGGG